MHPKAALHLLRITSNPGTLPELETKRHHLPPLTILGAGNSKSVNRDLFQQERFLNQLPDYDWVILLQTEVKLNGGPYEIWTGIKNVQEKQGGVKVIFASSDGFPVLGLVAAEVGALKELAKRHRYNTCSSLKEWWQEIYYTETAGAAAVAGLDTRYNLFGYSSEQTAPILRYEKNGDGYQRLEVTITSEWGWFWIILVALFIGVMVFLLYKPVPAVKKNEPLYRVRLAI